MIVLTGKAMDVYRRFKPINIEGATTGWFLDEVVPWDDELYWSVSWIVQQKPKECIEQIEW